MSNPSPTGDLTLGHILSAAGIGFEEVLVIRHTLTEGGLAAGALTPDGLLAYTREQGLGNKVGNNPQRYWLCFMADGGLCSPAESGR